MMPRMSQMMQMNVLQSTHGSPSDARSSLPQERQTMASRSRVLAMSKRYTSTARLREHHRRQLVEQEWLAHRGASGGGQRGARRLALGIARHEEDPRAQPRHAAQLREHLIARHVRQPQIDDDRIVGVERRQRDRLAARGHGLDEMPESTKVLADGG